MSTSPTLIGVARIAWPGVFEVVRRSPGVMAPFSALTFARHDPDERHGEPGLSVRRRVLVRRLESAFPEPHVADKIRIGGIDAGEIGSVGGRRMREQPIRADDEHVPRLVGRAQTGGAKHLREVRRDRRRGHRRARRRCGGRRTPARRHPAPDRGAALR